MDSNENDKVEAKDNNQSASEQRNQAESGEEIREAVSIGLPAVGPEAAQAQSQQQDSGATEAQEKVEVKESADLKNAQAAQEPAAITEGTLQQSVPNGTANENKQVGDSKDENVLKTTQVSQEANLRSEAVLATEDDQPPVNENLIVEHKMTIDEVCEKFKASFDIKKPLKSQGLSSESAKEILERDGPNALSPPKKPSHFKQFIKHLCGLFNILMIISGILSLILYPVSKGDETNIYLAVTLIVVAFLNALIEFYQEYKSEAILESFLSLIPLSSNVIRDGKIQEVDAVNLVAGDLVVIKAGEKIPADLRLVYSNEVKVDNSSITGESEPQERNLKKGSDNPLEATNLLFSGNMIVAGDAVGVVIRTGDRTMLGQIASLATKDDKRTSQLAKEIDLFVKKLATVAIITAVIFLIIGFSLNYSVSVTLVSAIGIFVSFVPQGLPATVMLLLTIAAKKLADKQVLVKDLHSVETLGSITMLATDKTGTLTQNRMTVVGSWLNSEIYSTDNNQHDTAMLDMSVNLLTDDVKNLPEIVKMCSLCTNARFDIENEDIPLEESNVIGDATEIGLLKFAAQYIPDTVLTILETNPKVCEIPFSSSTKWHLTIHKMKTETGNYVIYLKGAPERVAKLCKYFRMEDEDLPWTEESTEKFNKAYEYYASKGQRVLAFARIELPANEYGEDFVFEKDPLNFPTDGFTFIGLVSLMDPPKRGVRKAVAACRTAGIQVVMVTGDHPITAEAIGRKIGLISGETKEEAARRQKKPMDLIAEEEYDVMVIHGDKLEGFTDQDWDLVLSKKEIIFARTSPTQKLEIVSRSQAKGHIVGVSGDGVNDSPALQKADLGISMNKTASDVSKEAAAMILLDDDFASIVVGIAEGRLIFENLKKSIRYTLTHMVPEILPFLIFIIFGLPTPITSLLILFIDLGTELGPALAYAYELPENDLMLIPPRKVLCTTTMSNIAFEREEEIPPKQNVFVKTWKWIKKQFSRNETGEVLIDNELLLYVTFEGGVIEFIGCIGAYLITMAINNVPFNYLSGTANRYFLDSTAPEDTIPLTNGEIATPEMQVKILQEANAAYFLSIVICQAFNHFVCKHRYSYSYGWDMLKNKYSIIGIVLGFCMAAVIVYVPGIQKIVGTQAVSPLALLSAVAAGIALFAFDFASKFLKKRGYFGGMPKRNENLLELVRTTSTL